MFSVAAAAVLAWSAAAAAVSNFCCTLGLSLSPVVCEVNPSSFTISLLLHLLRSFDVISPSSSSYSTLSYPILSLPPSFPPPPSSFVTFHHHQHITCTYSFCSFLRLLLFFFFFYIYFYCNSHTTHTHTSDHQLQTHRQKLQPLLLLLYNSLPHSLLLQPTVNSTCDKHHHHHHNHNSYYPLFVYLLIMSNHYDVSFP